MGVTILEETFPGELDVCDVCEEVFPDAKRAEHGCFTLDADGSVWAQIYDLHYELYKRDRWLERAELGGQAWAALVRELGPRVVERQDVQGRRFMVVALGYSPHVDVTASLTFPPWACKPTCWEGFRPKRENFVPVPARELNTATAQSILKERFPYFPRRVRERRADGSGFNGTPRALRTSRKPWER